MHSVPTVDPKLRLRRARVSEPQVQLGDVQEDGTLGSHRFDRACAGVPRLRIAVWVRLETRALFRSRRRAGGRVRALAGVPHYRSGCRTMDPARTPSEAAVRARYRPAGRRRRSSRAHGHAFIAVCVCVRDHTRNPASRRTGRGARVGNRSSCGGEALASPTAPLGEIAEVMVQRCFLAMQEPR